MKFIFDWTDGMLEDRGLWVFFSAILAIGIVYSVQASLFIPAAPNFDDTEHLHASWLVYKGYVPHRDFFEHHNPMLWYLLSPLFDFYKDDIGVVDAAKYLMLLVSLFSIAVFYSLARGFLGGKTSLLAVILLVTQYNFFLSMSRIIPENIIILLSLVSLKAAYMGLERRNARWLYVSGFSMGLGFCFKQTAAIVFLALPASLLFLWLLGGRRSREHSAGLLAGVLGFALPVIALFWFFSEKNALLQYVYENFMLNIHSSTSFFVRFFELSNLYFDVVFWMLAYLSLIPALRRAAYGTLKPTSVVLLSYVVFIHMSLFTSPILPSYRLALLAPFMAFYAAETAARFWDYRMRLAAGLMVFLCVVNPVLNMSAYQYHSEVKMLLLGRPEREFYEFIYTLVPDNGTILDFSGSYIYRMHAYSTWFFFDYTGGYFTMNTREYEGLPAELEKSHPVALIEPKSGLLTTLSSENMGFLDENFKCVTESGGVRLYVPSKTFSRERQDEGMEFTILTPGRYDVTKPESAEILIDGARVGKQVHLAAGAHTMNISKSLGGDLTLTYRHPKVPEGRGCKVLPFREIPY